MKTHLLIVSLCSLAFGTAISAENTIPLDNYLREFGRRAGLTFTLELLEQESFSKQIPMIATDAAKEEYTLARLSQKLPLFTIVINKRHAKVVNVIDNSFLKKRDYGLNHTLKRYVFKGPLEDITVGISREVPSVMSYPMLISGGGPLVELNGPIVSVNMSNASVRDVLSSIPVESVPLLWVARCSPASNYATAVTFFKE